MAHAHAAEVQLGKPDDATLALSGALTFATAARAFNEGTRRLLAGTQTRLDLAGVAHADSAGLACVLALAACADRAGRRLEVVHWPQGLRALADVCGAGELLDARARAAA